MRDQDRHNLGAAAERGRAWWVWGEAAWWGLWMPVGRRVGRAEKEAAPALAGPSGSHVTRKSHFVLTFARATQVGSASSAGGRPAGGLPGQAGPWLVSRGPSPGSQAAPMALFFLPPGAARRPRRTRLKTPSRSSSWP